MTNAVKDAIDRHFDQVLLSTVRLAPGGQLMPEERRQIVNHTLHAMRCAGFELRRGWTLDVWLVRQVLVVRTVAPDGALYDASAPEAWVERTE